MLPNRKACLLGDVLKDDGTGLDRAADGDRTLLAVVGGWEDAGGNGTTFCRRLSAFLSGSFLAFQRYLCAHCHRRGGQEQAKCEGPKE